ncbi:hypothetical protein SAMN03159495_4141 [Pseudomonas sp. NFR16]|nr:hypothetical protein SAMN03159495_4141 [Pseudomonas sp. NFR16]
MHQLFDDGPAPQGELRVRKPPGIKSAFLPGSLQQIPPMPGPSTIE